MGLGCSILSAASTTDIRGLHCVWLAVLVSYLPTSLHKEARGCLHLLWLHLHALFASTIDISALHCVLLALLVSYPPTSLHKEARGCLHLLWLHLHALFASTTDISALHCFSFAFSSTLALSLLAGCTSVDPCVGALPYGMGQLLATANS